MLTPSGLSETLDNYDRLARLVRLMDLNKKGIYLLKISKELSSTEVLNIMAEYSEATRTEFHIKKYEVKPEDTVSKSVGCLTKELDIWLRKQHTENANENNILLVDLSFITNGQILELYFIWMRMNNFLLTSNNSGPVLIIFSESMGDSEVDSHKALLPITLEVSLALKQACQIQE